MAKKGEVYECGVCGVEVQCTKGCGCEVSDLICCGKTMKRKTHKKPKSVKKK